MWQPQKVINNKYGRIVALIDMDCFYCQVEEQMNPSLKGKPIIVQPLQYDDYGGGGCIAINYVARARGVKRSMRGDEARKICADLECVRVPVVRGKADLSKYRNAGKQVAAVLQTFTPLMARASVDEAYLDLTERVNNRLIDMNNGKYSLRPDALTNTFAVGYHEFGEYVRFVTKTFSQVTDNDDEGLEDASVEDLEDIRKSDIKLLIASSIVNEIRATVKEKTGYECSAGIAHNKILAKIVCGMNKPNKQTVLPLTQISEFYRTLPIKKVQGLGGKLGDRICSELNVLHMADLQPFPKEDLKQRYEEKMGQWLYNLARGIDVENIVEPRLVPKSISCTKMFPRHNAITELSKLRHWLQEIAKDVVERVEEDELDNNRRPKQMIVIFSQTIRNADVSCSRTVNITTIDEEKIVNDAINVIKKNTSKFFKNDDGNSLNNPIKYLGFNVTKFESLDKPSKTISDMFVKSKKKVEQRVQELATFSIDKDETNQECNGDISTSFLSKDYVKNRDNKVLSSGNESVKENDVVANKILKMVNDEVNTNLQKCSPNSPIPIYQPSPPAIEEIKSNECGKMIGASEFQVHADAHFAFQLKQELRTEFQDHLKRPQVSKTPVKKRLKSDSHHKPEMLPIEKYFVKDEEKTPESTTSTGCSVEVEKCSECGKDIPIIEFFEHMDFHAAKRLQVEIMKSEMKNNRPNSSIKKPNNNSNNKSSNKNKKQTKKDVTSKNTAVRNITAFFQKID